MRQYTLEISYRLELVLEGLTWEAVACWLWLRSDHVPSGYAKRSVWTLAFDLLLGMCTVHHLLQLSINFMKYLTPSCEAAPIWAKDIDGDQLKVTIHTYPIRTLMKFLELRLLFIASGQNVRWVTHEINESMAPSWNGGRHFLLPYTTIERTLARQNLTCIPDFEQSSY